jgi:hypothetical protein
MEAVKIKIRRCKEYETVEAKNAGRELVMLQGVVVQKENKSTLKGY